MFIFERMDIRGFRDDAWEFCRQNFRPGDVALVEKAMKFGYDRGILDATKRLRTAVDEICEKREKAGRPT
jgi:hypothetical protein